MNLEIAMKRVQATTFAFYLKSHNFHWNVEGPDFYQYHKFLDDLYNEVWTAVDAIAEHVRALDIYVPGSFARFSELSAIEDQTEIPRAALMIEELYHDNEIVIDTLTEAFRLAETKHLGLANFLQDRIDIHEKHGWMLRSLLKVQRA